jgi:hypothetical protein
MSPRQKTPVEESLKEKLSRLSATLEEQRQELDEQRQRLQILEAGAERISDGGAANGESKHSRREPQQLAAAVLARRSGRGRRGR